MGLLFLAFLGAYLPNGMFQDVSIIPMVNVLLLFFGGTIIGLTPWLAPATSSERFDRWLPERQLAMSMR